MQHSLEQRIAIKFSTKLGKTATETVSMIKTAYKEGALSDRHVFLWHKAFLEGREEVDNESRSGRPKTARTDENINRLTIQQIADTLHMFTFAVHGIGTEDLKTRKF